MHVNSQHLNCLPEHFNTNLLIRLSWKIFNLSSNFPSFTDFCLGTTVYLQFPLSVCSDCFLRFSLQVEKKQQFWGMSLQVCLGLGRCVHGLASKAVDPCLRVSVFPLSTHVPKYFSESRPVILVWVSSMPQHLRIYTTIFHMWQWQAEEVVPINRYWRYQYFSLDPHTTTSSRCGYECAWLFQYVGPLTTW